MLSRFAGKVDLGLLWKTIDQKVIKRKSNLIQTAKSK
jgi:hypothetical protein